jgi:hypothetical protein
LTAADPSRGFGDHAAHELELVSLVPLRVGT